MTTDRIELFLLDPAVDVGTQATFRALYLEHAYPIVASAVVSTSAVQRVVGRWVEFLSERTASGGAADCFPTYGIRFFSSGRVICEGVIGWETWNYDLSIRGKEIYRGMDWRSPVPKAFKACVEAFLPIPAELRGTNFLFRLIAHTERAFNKAREATR